MVIEVHAASYRTTRGYTVVAALLDELAFWPPPRNSSEPDVEVINAIRPGMATVPGAMLLCASSPYARKGALFDAHRKHFGKDGDPVLCWHAPTRDMNPSVPQAVIDEAMERDPAFAAAEYGAEFRSDIGSSLKEPRSRLALPSAFASALRCRRFTTSASSILLVVRLTASRWQSATSRTRSRSSMRSVRSGRRFSPESVVIEFVDLLKRYRVSTITGDRYAGEWPREAFRKLEVQYELSARPKSAIYQDFLPLVNSGQVELLDHPRLVAQLCSLERRTARGGRDSIDHPPGAHDDIANVVAGVVVTLGGAIDHTNLDWICGPADDVAGVARHVSMSERAEHARRQLWAHVLSDGR